MLPAFFMVQRLIMILINCSFLESPDCIRLPAYNEIIIKILARIISERLLKEDIRHQTDSGFFVQTGNIDGLTY